jgi:hypothetical protein
MDKAETFKINYETMRQENDDLVKQISEKLSIIQNLSSQMEKLELEKVYIHFTRFKTDVQNVLIQNFAFSDLIRDAPTEQTSANSSRVHSKRPTWFGHSKVGGR